jgi:retron-type reverse transcriptase
MKVYKDLYWSIISPKTLFRAWKVFQSDKRNKLDVAVFELDLERNIFGLYRDLKSEKYKHGPYKGFWIHDPKLRRIHKAIVRDRVLHHAIFSVLNAIFEPTFISDSYSCRIDKGTHKGMERVRDMLRSVSKNNTQPCYALKCDVRRFFDSMDHNILLAILYKRIKDEQVQRLLKEIVCSFSANNLTLFERRGVPIGNLTSQVFANIYMNEFDQFVKQALLVKNYARYTDDFVIVSDDRTYLETLLPLIQEFLKDKLRLELHPKKITIRKYHEGIDFLGYVIFPHHIKLRSKTKRKIPRKIRERIRLYKNGVITEASLRSSLASYLGVLSHANAYELSNDIKNKFWFWIKE